MAELTMADLAAAMRAVVRGLFDRLDIEQRSVWRDLRRDFAGDLLAQHYAGVRH
jgi:hypothetical protein